MPQMGPILVSYLADFGDLTEAEEKEFSRKK